MGRLDRAEHLQEQAHACPWIEPSLRAPAVDRHAIDVLHHDVGLTLIGAAAIEHMGDVGVLDRREELALGFGAARGVGVAERAGQHLDRDALPEHAIDALGQPDLAHAAASDRLEEPVRAELAPDRRLRIEKALARRVRLEQGQRGAAQGRIVGGRATDERLAPGCGQLECALEQRKRRRGNRGIGRDRLARIHRNAWNRNVRATSQSRCAVAREMSSTSATSSMVRPAK